MTTKTCTWCLETKPVEQFSIRRGELRQAHCKACHSEYHRTHYLKNKDQYVASAEQRKVKLREFVLTFKTGKSCTDCKKEYPSHILQFDHLPGTEKKIHLANVHEQGWSTIRILEEISKCELVCANCHADRTFKRGRRLKVRQQSSKL